MTTIAPVRVRPADVLFPLGLGTALSLMGDATLYTVLPTHASDAGITVASVGIILGVNRAIRLLSNGPAGLAYDRYRRRPIFIPALFLGALSTAMYATGHSFWPLFAGRLLWGLAWSGIWVGGATMILDVTVADDRGRWTGLYQTWFFLGSGLGSLSGGFLTDRVGYAATMWAGAAVTALGALVALITLPETHNLRRPESAATAGRPAAVTALRLNGRLWAAVILQGMNRFVFSGVMSATIALLVQEQLKNPSPLLGVATLTGIVMAGRTFVSMSAAPLCGTASDLLKSRWLVTAAAVAAGLVGVLLMAQANAIGLLAGIILTSIASGGIQVMTTTLTGDLVSHAQRGRAIGLLHTSGDFGSAVGPMIAYAFLPFLALQGVYIMCGVLLAGGLALALWFQLQSAISMTR